MNLTDRTAWNTTTDDDGSDDGWATPGVDIRTTSTGDTGAATSGSARQGWGYDHPINQASKDAWDRAGVGGEQESSSWDQPESPHGINANGWGGEAPGGTRPSSAQSGIDANGRGLPGVDADGSPSSEEEQTEEENAVELDPTEKLTPRWGQPATPSQVQAPRPTSESMASGRRYEVKGGPDMETSPANGPVDYIDRGATPPQICFAA